MSAAERQLNPSEFSDEQVERLGFALMAFLEKYSVLTMKPMTIEATASYLNVSVSTVHRLRRENVLKPHYIGELDIPYYFPQEVFKAFKDKKH